MTHSALYPPNRQWLSEDVIGAVSERCWPSYLHVEQRTFTTDSGTVRYDTDPARTILVQASVRGTPQSDDATPTRGHHAVQGTSRAIALASVEAGKPSTDRRSDRPRVSTRGSRSNGTRSDANRDQQVNAMTALKLLRERRRMTQVRYRKKLRDHAATLEEEVQLLREQVCQLEMKRQTITPRMISSTTALSVAAEYFRLFRYGLSAYVPPSERPSTTGGIFPYESRVQRDFLFATMADEVACQSGRGAEALLSDWKLTTIAQPDIDIQVVRLEYGPSGSVITTTTVGVVISESTLRYAFPHLSKSDRGREIVSKLLGQRFVTNSSTFFEWDNENGCVVSLQYKSDIVTPMLWLLGSSEELSFVFDDACVTLDATLVID